METGREFLNSTQHILKGLGGNRLKYSDCFLWLLKRNPPPPVPAPFPSQSSSMASQARKDKEEKKEYLKQMSVMAKIVQQQRLENKRLEKTFSDSKRQALQLSAALSTRGTNLSHQRSLDITTLSPEEEDLTVL
jgi:hypothetical protein